MLDRRITYRGPLSFPVVENGDRQLQAVNLSSTGVLLDRSATAGSPPDGVVELELCLPELNKPIRARAEPVWTQASQQAFRFLEMADADRLNLAEALDRLGRRAEVK